MRNHEVTKSQLLLDEHGELREPGWSRSLVQQYRRSDIKAPKFRIKEWDYYLVVNKDFAAAFTISDPLDPQGNPQVYSLMKGFLQTKGRWKTRLGPRVLPGHRLALPLLCAPLESRSAENQAEDHKTLW